MDEPGSGDGTLIYNGELHALLTAAEAQAGGSKEKAQDAVLELQRLAAKEHAMPLEFGPPSIEKPTDELLGEILLQLHRPAEARDAFHAALSRTPGRKLVVESLIRTEKELSEKEAGVKSAADSLAPKR
jgi:predicted Zn-dependent protease